MAFERSGLENEGARQGGFSDNGTEFGVVTEGGANHQKEGRQRGADGGSGEDGGRDLEAGKGHRKGKKEIKGAEASVKVERNHREKRRGRNRGVTPSSGSGSASEKAKSRRKEKARTSGTKSRGGGKEREKRVRDIGSESSSDSESDRKKREERSRDRSRHRSSRKRHRSSKKRERVDSGSDSETGSGSEDRRTRERRKKKEKKEKKRQKHQKERAGKRRDATGLEEMEGELETENGRELGQPERSGVNRQQEAARQAAEDLKQTMRQNAEVARARLAGEVERARAQQMAMQNQFGAVDGRAVKKLNAEKRKLKSMVKAGHKLEALEAKEAARMDAFRIAMGLPTAEAQRQAEWRAEATQQAALLHATSAHAMLAQEPATPRRTLGPAMPGSKHKTSHD